MIQLENSAISDGLRRVLGQIVGRFRPRMVILFGSHARGEATPDSDVDLLVVMDAVENPLRMAAKISASVAHPFPLDILVVRSDQLEASAGRNGVFATEILTQGQVLYEAGD